MFGVVKRVAIAAVLLSAGWMGFNATSQAETAAVSYISVGDQTLVPYGWVDFCARYAGECETGPERALDVKATARTMKAIEKINLWVNANIVAKSDMEQWGVVDRWDYPSTGFGDCEDFVLLKRKLLIDEGFPRQALLVTVVKDENGDGHAVLTVKTSKGEYILDNLHDEVKLWTRTPYRYVKRQSQTDQRVWVSIGSPTAAPQMVSR